MVFQLRKFLLVINLLIQVIIKLPNYQWYCQSFRQYGKIWHHAFFNYLGRTPENHPALLTEATMNPKANREKMTQILFNVPSFYVAIPAVLSIYAYGRTTGIVVDSGHGVSQTVPIYEGKANTEYLVQLMSESNLLIPSLVAEDIKENMCYFALDNEDEMTKYQDRPYKLPDGNVVVIQNQIFRCPELLLKLSIIGLDVPGIHELTFKSIMNCDIDIRMDFYQNIILSGGNTLFPGLPERLGKELSSLSSQNFQIQIFQPSKELSPLIGGSIFAQLLSSSSGWITRSEYDEQGPSIVHRKFF
ncbi:unnamed protein product [Paramecium octaurelia]|uniref:Actin, cytoplasmic n=1 Tax=Paramecium octaurelia TaxID=43137 RepID=A0A8S1VA16_PAROT|nr:unnamed protein product [Paramecium octaurelia]